jgi:hypothetical protein
VLQVYALLNFVFWLALLLGLYYFSGFRHFRDVLLAGSLLWSTGTLTSLARALTDLPATAISFLGVLLSRYWVGAPLSLGVAALFKETSALSFFAQLWPDPKRQSVGWARFFVACGVMAAPVIAWVLYVHLKLHSGAELGRYNFASPFAGISDKLIEAVFQVFAAGDRRGQFRLLFELICPLSLLVQSIYLLAMPRLNSPIWRMGAGFAVLLFFLGSGIWVEQYAYSRVLLPLTFSFNFLVHQYERGARFKVWYVLGNIGMSWMCLRILV